MATLAEFFFPVEIVASSFVSRTETIKILNSVITSDMRMIFINPVPFSIINKRRVSNRKVFRKQMRDLLKKTQVVRTCTDFRTKPSRTVHEQKYAIGLFLRNHHFSQ